MNYINVDAPSIIVSASQIMQIYIENHISWIYLLLGG